MPCLSPLTGYRTKSGQITHNPRFAIDDGTVTVSCKQCIECRLRRSASWATRCIHEASLFQNNSFITLTYSPEHLPEGGTLVVKDFQDFMKRLRKRVGSGVRFFHCGEYGETTSRPHYHALLFNLDFHDKQEWKKRDEFTYYSSPFLSEVWGKGHCTIGEVNFLTAAYVARYVLKKVTGPAADNHYQNINVNTGEIFDLKPEYVTMSRRPGIGKLWYEKFKGDVYPSDEVIIDRGGKMVKIPPPKYYDGLFELDDPESFEQLKFQRQEKAKSYSGAYTPERLAVREQLMTLKLQQLKRGYENDT